MKKIMRLFIIIISHIVILSCISCTTYLNPYNFDMKGIHAPFLQTSKPISVRARLVGTSVRELPLPSGAVIVNEDDFTKVLVDKITESLKNKAVTVTHDTDGTIEIQVDRVSIEPTATMNCVIDYKRRLGNGEFYGFQSRSENWNFVTACDNALEKAVNDIFLTSKPQLNI